MNSNPPIDRGTVNSTFSRKLRGRDETAMSIWVVEMWSDDVYRHRASRWEPTVGVGFTRAQARWECREWRKKNPNDRFRVRKYSR